MAPQTAAQALQRTEEKHPAGMIEQQVVFLCPDVVGDLVDERCVGDLDAGDGVCRGSHDRSSFDSVRLMHSVWLGGAQIPMADLPSFPQKPTQWLGG
jgi:hypothetical protein